MLCPHIVPAVHVIGHACEQGVRLEHAACVVLCLHGDVVNYLAMLSPNYHFGLTRSPNEYGLS